MREKERKGENRRIKERKIVKKRKLERERGEKERKYDVPKMYPKCYWQKCSKL